MPYEVIKRTTDQNVKGVSMGEKYNHLFRKDTSFRLPDSEAAQARDIRQRFGQDRKDGRDADVLVAEIPDRSESITFLNNWGSGSAWKQDRPWLEKE